MLAGPNHNNIYAVSINPSLGTNTVLQSTPVTATTQNVMPPQILQGVSTSQRPVQAIAQPNQVVSLTQSNQIISLTPVRPTYTEYPPVKYHHCSYCNKSLSSRYSNEIFFFTTVLMFINGNIYTLYVDC